MAAVTALLRATSLWFFVFFVFFYGLTYKLDFFASKLVSSNCTTLDLAC